jgi:hypothetical protein
MVVGCVGFISVCDNECEVQDTAIAVNSGTHQQIMCRSVAHVGCITTARLDSGEICAATALMERAAAMNGPD